MVNPIYVQNQLKKIQFTTNRFNKAEVKELQHILHPQETIYECVNGYYEGGVALLVATDIRILLIDKKPMGFLNVDDLRFDMISDIDYSHRILGAQININCGMKNLIFKSYNQQRLRKLIGQVQHRMSEIKLEQTQGASVQKQHLEEINKQLQMYLLAQQQHLERQVTANQSPAPIKPSPQLADYLFAQRLLEDFNKQSNQSLPTSADKEQFSSKLTADQAPNQEPGNNQALLDEMAEAGRLEVNGALDKVSHSPIQTNAVVQGPDNYQGTDLTFFRIAYAKLPYLLRTRRYRKPFTT